MDETSGTSAGSLKVSSNGLLTMVQMMGSKREWLHIQTITPLSGFEV